jgi:DMSO/TMAO reductase YedYZ heme-binding membrane subunit
MKLFIKVIIFIFFLFVLSVPIILINQDLSFKKTADLLFFIHRGLGLYAFSLIFLALVMGSSITLLDRLFTPGRTFIVHQIIASLGFALAILHPASLLSTYISEGNLSYVIPFLLGINLFYFLLGIFALLLLILTVSSALLRFRLGPRWLSIHRFNYLVFWLVFFHSLYLGVDTQLSFARVIFLIYGVIVAVVTIRRILVNRV